MFVRSVAGHGNAPLLQRYGAELGRIVDRSQAELALIQRSELQKMDALMRNIVQQSFDGILSIGDDGRVKTANDAALRIFGYSRQELVDRHIAKLFPQIQDYKRIGDSQAGHGGERLEGMARRKDGADFPIELSLRTTTVNHEHRLIAIVRDLTAPKAQEQRLRHLALHDALTGLPNRVLLRDRLTHALQVAGREHKPIALLLLDLDRFKEVNDTLGHHVGDLLLTDLAQRLRTCIRGSDTIARLGGDEFAILLPAASDLNRALDVSQRIVASVQQPLEVIEGLRMEVGISIGIALFPEHADNESKLMQCTDVAMYAAKKGTHATQAYDRDKDHNNVRNLTLSGGLRQAIEGDQLSLEYQPKLDLQTRAICSVEALARWIHPTQGLIPPDDFVPQAEQTGMIQPFTRWSFNAAFAQVAEWQGAGINMSLALNLSTRSLHDEELPSIVASLLGEWQINPHLITLELTESAVMLDPDGALKNLRRLHDLGLRLSIDDFGTGYSSLSHLQRLPLDELKIDKSFVVNMTTSDHDMVIVRSTIDLAHNLKLKVVAEGVESEEHIEALHDLGCDLGQGFFIAKPMPIDLLDDWLGQTRWQIGRHIDAAAVASMTA